MNEGPIVGFVTPPKTYDPSASEFPRVIDAPVRSQQAPLPLWDVDYQIATIAFEMVQSALRATARSLASCGADVVVQMGTPFAFAGLDTEGEARARHVLLEQTTTVPVVMNAFAIVDGLRQLGAKRLALTCTYYDDEWKASWRAFMQACGFEVVYAATMANQGILVTDDPWHDVGWAISPELTRACLLKTKEDAPGADAIVLTGAGNRTVGRLEDYEEATGMPIVAADTAPYWAATRILKLPLKPGILGRLGEV